ncbi:hypothetical protein [Microbulbifer litoralis]|uniref:hypothetical protein n=1 Tax=Microbulbifer litoralis TaxID=2933965 RepID=UPI0020289F50|nr:hypothetical protein [Microbulbifer sp. GX H0434]
MGTQYLANATCIEDLEHDCRNHRELRERQKGRGTAYAYQCLICGQAVGSEVSKKRVSAPPRPFDEDIAEYYSSVRLGFLEEIQKEWAKNRPSLSPRPRSVDLNDSFSRKINQVIKDFRAEHPDCEIHRLFESYLVKQRITHIDALESRWSSESELSYWFRQNFSRWFEIYEEVDGVGTIDQEQKNLRIDFVIRPKPILQRAGFADQYMGVEVKFLDPRSDKGFHGKSSKGIFQALSYWYSGSNWEITSGHKVKLSAVLLFSNLSFADEREYLFGTYDRHTRTLWRAYLSLANHANVGELQIRRYPNGRFAWFLAFNGDYYFSKHYDERLILGNANVVNKKRIGNTR